MVMVLIYLQDGAYYKRRGHANAEHQQIWQKVQVDALTLLQQGTQEGQLTFGVWWIPGAGGKMGGSDI